MADQGLMDFSNLPQVVIVNILKHLAYPDFKIARLVCFNWYNASLLYDRDRLIFRVIDDVCCVNESLCMPSDLLQCRRDVLHLSFEYARKDIIDTWLNNTTVWRQHGAKISSLCLHYCRFNEEQLLRSLRYCTALKCLEIVLCDIESSDLEDSNNKNDELEDNTSLMQFLQLESFHFYVLRCFTDFNLFKTLMSMSPNLKFLTVQCDMWKRLNIEDQPKFYETVVSYLEKSSDIEELGFYMENDALGEGIIPDRLLSAPNLRLRKLWVKALLIEKTLMHQKEWLEDLKLSVTSSEFLNPVELNVIPRELHYLKRLKMYFDNGDASCVKYFTSLKNLVVLELSFDELNRVDIKSSYILAGLCSTVNTTMKRLVLRYTNKLSEKCISEICRTHPALTSLGLVRLVGGVTDVSVQSIFYYLVLLESLCLDSDCTDDGISGVNKSESGDRLVINGYSFPVGYSIARLKKLRVLNLSSWHLKGELFRDGLKLPALREAKFTAVTEENFVSFVESHPMIEILEIDFATEYMVRAIISNLKRLKFVFIDDTERTLANPVLAKSVQKLRGHCDVMLWGS